MQKSENEIGDLKEIYRILTEWAIRGKLDWEEAREASLKLAALHPELSECPAVRDFRITLEDQSMPNPRWNFEDAN